MTPSSAVLSACRIALSILLVMASACDRDGPEPRAETAAEPGPAKAKVAEPPAPSRPAAPDPAIVAAQVRALLGRLSVGDDVGGWRVQEISGPAEGAVTVLLHRGDDTFPIWIVRRGGWEQLPPVHTDELDLFFGPLNGDRHEGDYAAAPLDAFTARLDRTVPLPEGM